MFRPNVGRAADWITWRSDIDVVLQQTLRNLTTSSVYYHLENVIVEGNRVTGIIDWTNVHFGDPRADFARTYTILRV